MSEDSPCFAAWNVLRWWCHQRGRPISISTLTSISGSSAAARIRSLVVWPAFLPHHWDILNQTAQGQDQDQDQAHTLRLWSSLRWASRWPASCRPRADLRTDRSLGGGEIGQQVDVVWWADKACLRYTADTQPILAVSQLGLQNEHALLRRGQLLLAIERCCQCNTLFPS